MKITPPELREKLFGKDIPEISQLVESLGDVKLPAGAMRMLAVKMIPQAIFMSIKEKAALADVSATYWYAEKKTKRFKEACMEQTKLIVGDQLPEVWNSFVTMAIMGETANQLKILEQCGILDRDKHETVVNVAIVNEMRQKNLRTGLEAFGYKVDEEVN